MGTFPLDAGTLLFEAVPPFVELLLSINDLIKLKFFSFPKSFTRSLDCDADDDGYSLMTFLFTPALPGGGGYTFVLT